MRGRIILVTLILSLSAIPTTQAGSPENLEDVGRFLVEFTWMQMFLATLRVHWLIYQPLLKTTQPTWCTNCISVENALKDIESENHMQTYHFHRYIGESEDPLGSQEGDERWIERYDERRPPTAVFNGTIRQVGTILMAIRSKTTSIKI